MTCLRVAKFQSWIRDHHSHNYKYTIGVKLGSLRVSENQRSEHVISVYLKKTNQKMKIVRYIPDALAKVVY